MAQDGRVLVYVQNNGIVRNNNYLATVHIDKVSANHDAKVISLTLSRKQTPQH